MEQYQDFEVEDFLTDDFFVNSVLYPDSKTSFYWKQWLIKYPHRTAVFNSAWTIASSISIKPSGNELRPEELREEAVRIQNILFSYTANKTRMPRLTRSLWFKAAAILLIIFAFTFIYYNRAVNVNQKNEVSSTFTIKENRSKQSMVIPMPDGSLAILKPGSSLKYDRNFSGRLREVVLLGEAFFEVRKNPSRPFLVHSQNMVTKVVGTSFSVSSYPQDKEFKVTVTTGKVLVYNQVQKPLKQSAILTLIPNQRAIFKRNELIFQKDSLTQPLPLSKAQAEKDFSFNEVPITIVLNKIESAYGITIIYDHSKMNNLTLNSPLSDLALDQKINVICQSINAKYTLENGQYRIVTN